MYIIANHHDSYYHNNSNTYIFYHRLQYPILLVLILSPFEGPDFSRDLTKILVSFYIFVAIYHSIAKLMSVVTSKTSITKKLLSYETEMESTLKQKLSFA